MNIIQPKVYENIFSLKELQFLINWADNEPVSGFQGLDEIRKVDVNKSLHYDVPGSPANLIIRPKLSQIVGSNHRFVGGSYKELKTPYAPHIDNDAYMIYLSKTSDSNIPNNINSELAFLIPLVEDERFKTVLFDIDDQDLFLAMGDPMLEHWLGGENDLDINDFDHVPEPTRSQIKRLPVDYVAPWKLGSIIVWRRSQLHTSTNYAKFGLTKKFIIVFVA
jgi:hypothetical protein